MSRIVKLIKWIVGDNTAETFFVIGLMEIIYLYFDHVLSVSHGISFILVSFVFAILDVIIGDSK